MSTNYTTTIPETDCIGDSLDTINNNFDNLGTTVLSLSTTPGWIPNSIIAFDGGAFSFKNKIINGAMNIWQRGTNFVNTTGVNYYTADRMMSVRGNAVVGITTSRSTDVPTGFRYSLKQQRTAGTTTLDGMQFHYIAETNDSISLQGKVVTFSFYAKKGNNFSGDQLVSDIATGTGVDQVYTSINNVVITQNNLFTTSWARYTVTGTIPANATQFRLSLYWFPTGTAGADDSIYITGLQFEVGPTATPFEFRPIETELNLCQRYYQKTYGQSVAPGTATTAGSLYSVPASTGAGIAFNNWRFSPIMRTIPATVVAYNPATGTTGQWRQGAANITAQLSDTSDSGVVVSNAVVVTVAVGMNVHVTADAEL